MKIAIVYQGIYPPEKGASGADRRIRDISRGISAAGNEVIFYNPIYHKSKVTNPDKASFDVQSIGSSFFNKIPLLNRIFFWLALLKSVKREKVESILFYNTSPESFLIAKSLKSKGITVVYEICDLMSNNDQGKSLKEKITAYGEIKIPQNTHLNIIISDYLEKHVMQVAPNTPTLKIPILVDTDLFTKKEPDRNQFNQGSGIGNDDILLAYVGGIWKQEGVGNLVLAFSKLIKLHPKVKLLIAGQLGKSELHDDVEKIVDDNNLREHVILTGLVDTNTVLAIYQNADIMVLPQIQHEFNKAGLPTKLAEYAAMAKPIVATSVGDVPVYFKNGYNALICTPSNPEDLFQALKKLIEDKELRDKLGENALNTALEYFDYRKNGQKIFEAIKKVTFSKIYQTH